MSLPRSPPSLQRPGELGWRVRSDTPNDGSDSDTRLSSCDPDAMRTHGEKLDAEDLAGAWADYKFHGDTDARNLIVLHYNSLVRAYATKIGAQLPKMVDRDDLISYGIFGLLDAIEKFDPTKNVKFETYAIPRIRGSIIDEIRSLDWVPRTVRAKSKDIERADQELSAILGRPPEDAEIAEHMGITLLELWTAQSQAFVSQLEAITDESGQYTDEIVVKGIPSDSSQDPEGHLLVGEVPTLMASAIDPLPKRSKTILVLYYIYEMTLAEIGEVLGVTESRVCQLQSKLFQSLQLNLGGAAA